MDSRSPSSPSPLRCPRCFRCFRCCCCCCFCFWVPQFFGGAVVSASSPLSFSLLPPQARRRQRLVLALACGPANSPPARHNSNSSSNSNSILVLVLCSVSRCLGLTVINSIHCLTRAPTILGQLSIRKHTLSLQWGRGHKEPVVSLAHVGLVSARLDLTRFESNYLQRARNTEA